MKSIKILLIFASGIALVAILWMEIPKIFAPTPVLAPTSTISTPPPRISTSSTKLVALTFDDGPYGTSTRQILDILRDKQVRATFFILGKNTEKFPDQVRREVDEGHVIGNHSYDHSAKLPSLATSTFVADLKEAEQAITKASGLRPTLYRPPYGALSQTMRRALASEGYRNVLWNVDPEDWDYEKSPRAEIVKRILATVKPNAIILMHDGRDTHVDYPRDNTVTALPFIIDGLRARGYTFVTVDELLQTTSK